MSLPPAFVPPQLAEYPHNWVAWKYQTRDGLRTKVPKNPRTGGNAMVNNPATWNTFENALAACNKYHLDGIGFMFGGTDLVGIDLDHARNPDAGAIAPEKQAMITALDSYTELSVSGSGLHVIARGVIPGKHRRKDSIGLEMYDRTSPRFFVFTGQHLASTPTDIRDRKEQIGALYQMAFPEPETEPTTAQPPAPATNLDDEELLSIMFSASNGSDIYALWNGDISKYVGDDGRPDESRADAGLCSHLAFYAGDDEAHIDRLFRNSRLYRPKWDEKRGASTYGSRTIQYILSQPHKTYQRSRNGHVGAESATTENDEPEPSEGPVGPGRAPKSEQFIDALCALGYTFRLNDCTDAVQVNGEDITDCVRSEIRTQMRDHGYARHLAAIEDAYVTEAYHHPYHPVRDYLDALPYQGSGHIDALCAHIHDAHNIIDLYLKCWLIGAVAKAYSGAQNAMLVMDGKQGIGKSHLVEWLCVLPGMYVDSFIDPSSNDHEILLISRWVWEVSELGATTRKADREALKAFISKQVVSIRKPYGHHPITKPALASFIGTINNESGILSDPTGNRRFNVCSLTEIDWSYQRNVDRAALWAEAVVRYRSGEPWQLTPAEAERAAAINAHFVIEDPVESYLTKFFTMTRSETDFLSTADILGRLQDSGYRATTRALQMELSACMKRMGLDKAMRGDVRGYVGIKHKGIGQ
jgi:hypothetical protein